MNLSDRKQRLLQQRLAKAGLLQAEQSFAMDRPKRELHHEGTKILSFAQLRMWYHAQLTEESAAYNFCLVLRPDLTNLNFSLSTTALIDAIEQVVRRHEILRTRYRVKKDGIPEQIVELHLPSRIIEIELEEGSNRNSELLKEQINKLACQARDEAFNLETDSPLRVLIICKNSIVIAIVLVLPHIAGDGGSFGTVIKDLERAYGHGNQPDALLAPSDIRYTDYALWEKRHLGDPKNPTSLHAKQLQFWEKQLVGIPAELSLPFDRPRPAMASFSGRQIRCWLGHGLSNALRQCVKGQGCTPLTVLQAAVSIALERVGAGKDIPLGTPVDLRQDSTLDQLVGFFSNTVVVRVNLTGDPTFSEFLYHVHDTGITALDNRDVPFENVVEYINPPRVAARNPLFTVMVTATRPWPSLKLGHIPIILEEPQQTQAKFDLTFVLYDEGVDGRIGISLLYACDLFDEITVKHLLELVIGILGQGVHHPQLRLSQLADFGLGCLDDQAADLMGVFVKHEQASLITKRAIRLAGGIKETDIIAALAKLLEHHDALRLRHDPVKDKWVFASAAELLETPILLSKSPDLDHIDRFVGWFSEVSGESYHDVGRILELCAPGYWVDDESWLLLLADLESIRLNGGNTLPYTVGVYVDWLNQTAELATQPEIVDYAESWLDMLEIAENRVVNVQSESLTDQSYVIDGKVTLPDLGVWPDPVALRKAAVAAILCVKSNSALPLFIQINEPDRDRSQNGILKNVVGWCRRSFPLLVAFPQEITPIDSIKHESLDALLQAAGKGIGLENIDGELSGDFATTYWLARDISPSVTGVFDQVPLPNIILTLIVTDLGDEFEAMPSSSLLGGESEHWIIRINPRNHQAILSIHARRNPSEIQTFIETWNRVFPQLVATTISNISNEKSDEEALIPISSWDFRRLTETFGTLREVLPLSPLQEGLRFHAIGASDGNHEVYISQTSLDLEGGIDVERFHQAVQKAVELTPTITVGFAEIAGTMVQVVPNHVYIPWRFEEAFHTDQIDRIADEEYHASFDAARPPLIRFALIRVIADHRCPFYRFLLTTHHILLDGWSIRLLFRLIMRLYDDFSITIAPTPFRRYLSWLQHQNITEAEAIWHEVLSGVEPTILYPMAQGLEANVKHSEERISNISSEITGALVKLARSASTTLSTVLELAWGTLLMRLSGSSNVVFGNVVSGRPADIEHVDEIIGLLFNTVPVKVQVQGNESIITALHYLHKQKAVSLQHSYVNLTRLQQIAGHSPLFDTLFAVQNLPPLGLSNHQKIQITNAHVRDATHYPLSMAVSPTEDGVGLRLMFRNDVITPDQAEVIVQAYIHTLEIFTHNYDLPLLIVDALSETNSLLPSSVSGDELEIGAYSVADLLVQQAVMTPKACAVVAEEKQLTFEELTASAHQLAHFLQKFGVNPEHRVALLLPRSEIMIIALFGVFAAHAAYVPIDPVTPIDRIRSILNQAEPTVILTTHAFTKQLPSEYEHDSRVVILDDHITQNTLMGLSSNPPHIKRPAGLEHLAYIIFTSGSTGEPKGVAVPYLGLTNMFVNHKKAIFSPILASQGGRRLKIAHTTSFAFDASWEQLLWLLFGHEVHVISDDLRRDPERLLPMFDHEQIDAFDVTPTYGEYLVEHGLLDRDRPQGRPGTGVVFVSLGGEAVSESLWKRLRSMPGLSAYNLYGPTEYTINALGANLSDSSEPTVGRPIANTSAYILGPGLLPSPVGVIGELYLSGVGLARGYIKRPAATAERFVANPFGKPGSRLYRTGDLARWRADGNIDFLGRSDNQLKIRGYRIEPAEIENALVSYVGVRRAAVLGRATQDGSLRLVAYVVCKPEISNAEKIKELLRSRFPSYMVPSAVIFVDDLPMTVNGKLDVASLPIQTASDNGIVLPLTAEERTICDVFATVLECGEIGRFDDFFESGGHSLLTVRLVSLLRDALGTDISIRQVYNHPTPAALAASLMIENGIAKEQNSIKDHDPDYEINVMINDAILPLDFFESKSDIVSSRPTLASVNSIFLTGAAGFLGSYILVELLHKTTANIYCLIRAKDQLLALDRIYTALAVYGLWEDGFKQRIIGIPGDLSRSRFGLSKTEFENLADQIDVIIHNGGATNEFDHYTRLAATNVTGAKEILQLAVNRRVKPVHFVSTASVVARVGINPPVINEDTRLAAHEVERTGYVQSKWVAEELMHSAAIQGLPIIIHRPGRVSGHSLTGTCSTGVGFWHFIRSMLLLHAVPELRSDRLTLAPVDYVAQALVALIERGNPGETYHLSNRMQTSIRDIMEAAQKVGYSLEFVSFNEWRERLIRTAELQAKQGDDSLSSVLLLAEHINKYDGSEEESALGQEKIIVALDGSGIAPPPVTSVVLSHYVEYFIKVGFFPPPE